MLSKAPNYRRPWWLGLIVLIVVLAVDINLLAPWVSWAHDSQDSGDLISSAYFLGIPHPTGYPTYCMLAKVVQTIVPINSIAWRTNLFSALSAAFCCALVALTVHRMLTSIRHLNGKGQTRAVSLIAITVGVALGLSRTFLSQSVVAEVYTLNAAFVAIDIALIIEILCSLYEGRSDRRIRRNLYILSLFYGLTLTNHLSSAFIFPLVIATFISARKFVNLRTIALSGFYFILGLTPYLYLPIRSASDTPYDWGNPQTLNGFLWVVSGSQFKHLMFASFDYQVIHRLFDTFEPFIETGPFLACVVMVGGASIARGGLASRISLVGISLMVLNLAPVMNYHIPDTQSFLLPTFIGATILLSLGLHEIIAPTRSRKAQILSWLLFFAIFLFSLPWYAANIRHADLSNHERPREYAERVYAELPPGAILVETFYGRAFTMWYQHFIESGENRKQVAVIYAEHMMFDWGIKKLHRLYPWVDLPGAIPHEGKVIEALVRKNSGSHPIFVSREIPSIKESYEFVPNGEIFLLRPRKNDNR